MQYATESKISFIAYDQYGDPFANITWSRSYVQISKDGGAFQICTNNPVSIGNGWYCLTLTATEMTCDTFIIKITPYPTNVTVQPIIGEPQRVTPATDTSTLATASSVSTLQTSVNAISTDISGLATAADLDDVKEWAAKVLGLAGDFTISGTTLTATNPDGTTTDYTLTLDQDGNITAITEATT